MRGKSKIIACHFGTVRSREYECGKDVLPSKPKLAKMVRVPLFVLHLLPPQTTSLSPFMTELSQIGSFSVVVLIY
jgi:hypothetical protein